MAQTLPRSRAMAPSVREVTTLAERTAPDRPSRSVGAIPRRGATPRRWPARDGRRVRRRPGRLRARRGRRAPGPRARAWSGSTPARSAAGAAGRNGGFLLAGMARFHHDAVAHWGAERAAALYRATLAELDRLAAELGPIVRRVGSLRTPASDAEAADCAAQHAALVRDGFPAERADGRRVRPRRRIDPAARALPHCSPSGRSTRGARLHCDTPGRRAGRRSRADAGRRGPLRRRRGVRRRRARAAPARARGHGALDAAADARHGARRARHRPLSRLRQLGLRLLAAAARRRDRARGRARPARRLGRARPSRAPPCRRTSRSCCAAASA